MLGYGLVNLFSAPLVLFLKGKINLSHRTEKVRTTQQGRIYAILTCEFDLEPAMQDILSRISMLNRPKLLVSAARHGAQNYQREKHLPRLLNLGTCAKHGQALMLLSDVEDTLNEQRLTHDAAYSLTRHVEVLIAIVAEAQLMRHARSQAYKGLTVVT
jgi:hypothetical protein